MSALHVEPKGWEDLFEYIDYQSAQNAVDKAVLEASERSMNG